MAKKKLSMSAAAGPSVADDFINGAPDAVVVGKAGRPRKPEATYVRMNVELKAETMAAFKILAVRRGKTIKELVSDMIEKEISTDA